MATHFPHRSRTPRSRLHTYTTRALTALGAGVLFFGVASIIEPTDSPAFSTQHFTQSTPGMLGYSRSESQQAGLLGTLIGAMYTVEIFAGTPEPLYTVYDAAGNTLVERAPKDEIYRIDPALDVDSMMGPAIGLVDHPDF